MIESVHEIVRSAEDNYLNGTTKRGKYVNFSMHDTIEKIDAYLNSTHTSGTTDSLGRDKPFFNIVTAAVNVWWRATDLDRKDIRFVPTKHTNVVLAFIANVLLQEWMNISGFGQFLNNWGITLARYGSAVSKFVEKDGQLIATVVPWNRIIADPVQYDALPRIEKFYLTPAQLRKRTEYDQDVVDELIKSKSSRKTLDKSDKDMMDDFIEIYEIHGELDSRLLEDDPEDVEDKNIKYRQQMHVISYIQQTKDEYKDFCLFKGPEKKDPYQKDDLIEEDGRTLAIGAVEYLFDSQWMQNHTIKAWKDQMDLASRLVFQTADPNFIGRNVLSAIETGDILIHGPNTPLTLLPNTGHDITNLQAFKQTWQGNDQTLTSTPEALRGITPPSGTPLGTTQIVNQNAASLFEIMTENKGLAVERMMRDHFIPWGRKKLKNKKEIVAILDEAGIKEIDAIYIPKAAIKRYNERAKEMVLNDQLPSQFDPLTEQQAVKDELQTLGNKRFFKPDDLDQHTWDDLFSDFEWDSVRVEVTNEAYDKNAMMTTLSSILQIIATNPMVLQDPNAKMVFNRLLSIAGGISPLELSVTPVQPAPMATMTPSSVGGGALPIK